MNAEKIHENDEIVVRISETNEDGDVAIYAHRKVGGVEQIPQGYVLGSNCLILKGQRSNVVLKGETKSQDAPFSDVDRLRELFGPRPGSELETKTTYVPTGEIIRHTGWNACNFLSVRGCRTFPASDFAWMVEYWMPCHAPQDLIALQIVERDLLR